MRSGLAVGRVIVLYIGGGDGEDRVILFLEHLS